ncbi:MAG: hypothetical protein R3Y11_01805 [Pseudomonadota bacterium]
MSAPRKTNKTVKAEVAMTQESEVIEVTSVETAMEQESVAVSTETATAPVAPRKASPADDEATIKAVEKTAVKQLHAQGKLRIIINSGAGSHEAAPVRVGVNGREYVIKRDVEVDVPKGVVNVLRRAKEKVGTMVDNAQTGRRHMEFRDKNRFSFQILGPVDNNGNLLSSW